MKATRYCKGPFAALVFASGLLSVGMGATPGRVWSYSLLEGSHLIDDCPVCARPTIREPMRGRFDLRLVQESPISSRYELERIAFTAGAAGRSYTITGRGTYTIGGEVALVQSMVLELYIDNGFTNRLCYFTNTTSAVSRLWPMLQIELDQTNGTFTQVYYLTLAAAPLREIWFSTVAGMTPGFWNPPSNHVSGGDLVSSIGRVVKSNHELTRRLGLKPVAPDLGLDAMDVMPGGEAVFSLEEDVFSETLGPLQHGDLLSIRGNIVKRNQQLTAEFAQMPPTNDAGLDAVQALDNGEVYFSIENDFFSQALGRQIRNGDLLSSRGVIVKSNEQLVARFQPADSRRDYGLDAFYVWPSGEVWFSVEVGFQGQQSEPYGPGDLLSDQGYIVFRNLELVSPFAPIEDLADFGLDALFVVTDATPPAPPPRFTRIQRERTSPLVHLEWDGTGRVFQLLRATDVLGPYVPVSPIIPDLMFDDADATASQSFYRLQQW